MNLDWAQFAATTEDAQTFYSFSNSVSPATASTNYSPPMASSNLLSELARDMHAKKMGTHGLTLVVAFKTREDYDRVKQTEVLCNATLRSLYDVEDAEILTNIFSEPGLEWRAMMLKPRRRSRLDCAFELFQDNGKKFYTPLMSIQVPAAVSSANSMSTTSAASLHSDVNMATHTCPPRRAKFTALDSIGHLWAGLGLPLHGLDSIELTGSNAGLGLPSSYKIGHIAQAAIGLSGLTASLIYSLRSDGMVRRVKVDLRHACAEFNSEKLYRIMGHLSPPLFGPIGGIHATSDGHVHIHDAFPHHRYGALALLGLPDSATKQEVAVCTRAWRAVDLESAAFDSGLVIVALRSYAQWDLLPQARAAPNFPIDIRQIAPSAPWLPPSMASASDKCLRGLRVVELSRVVAAPVAGRTLAAHGADVVWVTSPNLPDLPAIDPDLTRGKRRVDLDLNDAADRAKLMSLIVSADVFIQSYRPGSLVARGFGPDALARVNPNLIYANLSAYGSEGPWANRRGFDSLVQTCSGINISEAEHFGDGSPARPLPCQAFDHSAGYFLASGVMAALYKRATEGGSYTVNVSLAGCMKYLRSLGQYPGDVGFNCEIIDRPEQVEDLLETRSSAQGSLRAVRHSVQIEGVETGWDSMLQYLGNNVPDWLYPP